MNIFENWKGRKRLRESPCSNGWLWLGCYDCGAAQETQEAHLVSATLHTLARFVLHQQHLESVKTKQLLVPSPPNPLILLRPLCLAYFVSLLESCSSCSSKQRTLWGKIKPSAAPVHEGGHKIINTRLGGTIIHYLSPVRVVCVCFSKMAVNAVSSVPFYGKVQTHLKICLLFMEWGGGTVPYTKSWNVTTLLTFKIQSSKFHLGKIHGRN